MEMGLIAMEKGLIAILIIMNRVLILDRSRQYADGQWIECENIRCLGVGGLEAGAPCILLRYQNKPWWAVFIRLFGELMERVVGRRFG